MNKHLRTATFIALAVASASLLAETVTLGDMVDLEAKITLKKMTDELNKSSQLPGQFSQQQTGLTPSMMKSSGPLPDNSSSLPMKVKKLVPVTNAVYGISGDGETQYRGILNWGDESYPVKIGSVVHGYTVNSITSKGIRLTKTGKWKSHGSVIFSPLPFDSGQAVISQPTSYQVSKSE